MRALCGAIITAGALIGLGLTAVGYGLRYQGFGPDIINKTSGHIYGAPSLAVILITTLIGLVIGIGVAFLGLAYHHHRRHLELLRQSEAGGHTHVAA
ncbi:MAG TPA: hypothetical protein VGN42_11130 [Pirellulales bacterium]|nr:hypothetical protein [Pirellulales bacterium]